MTTVDDNFVELLIEGPLLSSLSLSFFLSLSTLFTSPVRCPHSVAAIFAGLQTCTSFEDAIEHLLSRCLACVLSQSAAVFVYDQGFILGAYTFKAQI